jgi:hypothetical protein
MMNRYRITANFPSLKAHESYQVVHVQASNWSIAMRRAILALKALPIIKRKQVKALSLVMVLEGRADQAQPGLQPRLVQGILLSEEG